MPRRIARHAPRIRYATAPAPTGRPVPPVAGCQTATAPTPPLPRDWTALVRAAVAGELVKPAEAAAAGQAHGIAAGAAWHLLDEYCDAAAGDDFSLEQVMPGDRWLVHELRG